MNVKDFYLGFKTEEGKDVTLCAVVVKSKDDNKTYINVGHSVKHDDDCSKTEIGRIIAKGRAIKKPLTSIEVVGLNFINTPVIESIIKTAKYYINNNPNILLNSNLKKIKSCSFCSES